MTIKVKPLVWSKVSTYFGGVFDADKYRVAQWHPSHWEINCIPGLFPTPEAAKAAAQADYEARILSAIEEDK